MCNNDCKTNGTALEDFLRSVQKGQENTIEVVRTMLPDDKGEKTVLALQNRVMQPEPPKAPERSESPRRAHVFHAMEGFCAYLNDNKTEKTVVFADVAGRTFYAVLDDTAGKGREVVTLEPQTHPLWKPWDDLLDDPMGVKDLAKFLLQHRRQIGGDDPKMLIADFSQIRAAAEVEVQQGTGKNAVNGLMIRTKIQGSKSDGLIDLPDTIIVNTPLFVGLPPQKIEVDVTLEPADPAGVSGVLATLTSADATDKTIRAFENMCEQVESEVKDIVIAMGKPQEQMWDTIDKDGKICMGGIITKGNEPF